MDAREKRQSIASHTHPDRESNLQSATQVCALTRTEPQPFGYCTLLQPTEPHQPGLLFHFTTHISIVTSPRRKQAE